MNRKLGRGLLVLALALLCMCVAVACAQEEHTHDFGQWQTVQEASCTAPGSQERTCACGEKETKTVAALGHTEVVDAAKAATCTEDGLTEGKHCSKCNTVIVKQESVAALGHTEVVDAAKAATC